MYCVGCSEFFKRSTDQKRVDTCKAGGDLKRRSPIDKTQPNRYRLLDSNDCFQATVNKGGT
jgi:hypothetical protein